MGEASAMWHFYPLYVPLTWFEIATSGPWSTGETKMLLDVCGADNAQHHLDRIEQNRRIYQKVASRLSELSYEHMWQQVLFR